ncbi:MAG: glycosyltransferase family 4 protein [Planctomycetia bacterium]|nr:glycosyltransferase family 4 protein [Planctomycetia bacterium]
MIADSRSSNSEASSDRCCQAPQANRPKVLFLNRCYWPDAEASGQLLTELCEDLSAEFDVTVVAGQPNQTVNGDAAKAWGRERHQGVTILRVPHFRAGKRSLWGRGLGMLSYLAGAAVAATFASRPAAIVVETDPFPLPLLARFLSWRHRCRLIVYLQDIYPDVAVALGKVREGRFTRFLRSRLYSTYRCADQVVVLGDDMRAALSASRIAPERVTRIANWADTSRIRPVRPDNPFRNREQLADRFVVMYSGNLGLCQNLDEVLKAAELLQGRTDVAFVLIGDGASRVRLQQTALQRGLFNVRFLPYQPVAELASSLSAADLHLVPLDPRVTGLIVPCKLYGILAAGVPALVVADERSETSRVVAEAGVGKVVPPGNASRLAEDIGWCADHRHELEEMGRRARRLAESEYDRKIATARFGEMLKVVLSGQSAEQKQTDSSSGNPAAVRAESPAA